MQAGQRSVGHPVNVATGVLHLARRDVSIGGRIALSWDRLYSTGVLSSSGISPLGLGWMNRYFTTLTKDEGQFRLLVVENAVETFADPNGWWSAAMSFETSVPSRN